MSQPTKMFSVNRKAFSLPAGVAIGGILLLIWFAIAQLDQQKYVVSVIFAVLTTALSDPGGGYPKRAWSMGAFGLGGAAVTALAFSVGTQAWGFVVLALFIVTLSAGLAVKFGLHRFSVALLLNIWFVVAVVLPFSYRAAHVKTTGGDQALAWLIGSASWIALMGIVWLLSRRKWKSRPVIDLPGEPFAPVKLTRPVVLFALIRALALAASAAIAYGFHEPNADWMVIATLIAMKPSLEQSRLVGRQRVDRCGHGRCRGHTDLAGSPRQGRLGGDHHPPGRDRGFHPRRELRLLHGCHRQCGAHRRRPATPHQLCGRGSPGALHVHRRGDRRGGHVHCGPDERTFGNGRAGTRVSLRRGVL